MKFNKIIAFTMAATMVLGSTVTAFAADTEIKANTTSGAESEATGAGTNAYYDKNIMKVVVPTLSGAFDYKVDPEGAVALAKKYDGVEVTSVTDTTGLIFKNKDGDKYKVTNSSDPFTITNKSAIPVNVSIEYKADNTSKDITTVATKKDFSGASDGPIYLEMNLTNDATQVFKTDATTIQTTLLSGVDGYELTNTGSTYALAEKSGYTAWPTSSYVITGAINKDLALSTWFNNGAQATDPRTAKSVPSISVKYSFTSVTDALDLTVGFFGTDDLYVGKTSDGFATGGGFSADPTTFTINGKTVTVSGLATSLGDGFTTKSYKVPFATIAQLFGVASGDVAGLTAEQKATIKGYVKAIQVTADSKTYYGEVQ